MLLKLNRSKSIVGTLLYLRKRPGMYVGGRDSNLLIGFLHGMTFCLSGSNVESYNSEIELIKSFLNYAFNKLEFIRKNNSIKTFGLHERLLMVTNNNGEKAFDLFFELWDEFVKEKGIIFEWEEKKT